MFLKDNLFKVFEGGGVLGIVYQEIKYDVKINQEMLDSLQIVTSKIR